MTLSGPSKTRAGDNLPPGGAAARPDRRRDDAGWAPVPAGAVRAIAALGAMALWTPGCAPDRIRTDERTDARRLRAARRPRAGFTLIEVVLSLSLIVMLAAMVTVGVSSQSERRRFAEAAGRFETLFRMARGAALNERRRFRIEFGGPGGQVDFDELTPVRVLWEPEHLVEPGIFVPYPLATWESYIPSGELRVLRCRLVGPSAYRTITTLTGSASDKEDDEALQAVTFCPDGWSDSALIELAPPEFESLLRAAIRWDGDSGNVKLQFLTETELEENHAEIEEGIYDGEDAS